MKEFHSFTIIGLLCFILTDTQGILNHPMGSLFWLISGIIFFVIGAIESWLK